MKIYRLECDNCGTIKGGFVGENAESRAERRAREHENHMQIHYNEDHNVKVKKRK